MHHTLNTTDPPDARACAELVLETIPALMRSMHGMIRHWSNHSDESPTIGQFRLLKMLACRPHSLGELAATHHVTPSTMSRSVDVLVRRAWVERQSDPNDRRQLILKLTTEGESIHTTMEQHSRDALVQMMEQLDPNERARLYDGLAILQGMLTTALESAPTSEKE